MKVTNYSNKLTDNKTTLLLGAFESFHNGHLDLIEKAKQFNFPLAIMLIKNVDQLPKHGTFHYADFETRLQWASNLGIDYGIVVEFNNQIKNLEGLEFLQNIIKSVNAQKIVVGSDFAIGKDRHFKANDVKKFFQNTFIYDLVKTKQGQKFSTSKLRQMITLGEVELILENSFFPFTIQGVFGSERDFTFRKSQIKPHSGFYGGFLENDSLKYPVAIFVSFQKEISVEFLVEKPILKQKFSKLEFHFQDQLIIKDQEVDWTKEKIDLIKAKF